MTATDNIQQTTPPTPAINCSWRFGDLSAAELLPLLQQHLENQDPGLQWQLLWLNNDGRPVIGLLPKVSWLAYFHQPSDLPYPNYKVITTCRDDENAVTTTYMSYAEWQDALITYSKAYESENPDSTSINEKNEQPYYHHGLMGFIGYDIAAVELSPTSNISQASQPCAVIGHYDIYLTSTNDNKDNWSLNIEISDTDSELQHLKLKALISYLNTLDNQLSTIERTNKSTDSLAPLILTAKWHKNDYQQAFAQTQRYLVQGDCYQINLTQEWRGQFVDNSYNNDKKATVLIDYLPALHRNTQAPFAGYLRVDNLESEVLRAKDSTLKNSGFELLSCSPELFFTFIKDANTGKHHIRTKPIKGTVPRGINTEQDLVLKQQLIDSDKDRAENVMIVDLLRNDLGKYAKTGSVKVPQLFNIESFSNVHHMVSTITAELKEDSHPLAVLFGSLPAGSITGTPKKRAVEIISDLEAAPRGAYCGTMGYMNFDGSGQWNVLIRTLQAEHSLSGEKQVSLWAGGGITIASDCDAEYQECLDKVGNLLTVLSQIDTIK